MGQYYKPINLDVFEWLSAHDYGNGLKIMEHSYLTNGFVTRVMKLLSKGGKWYKTRLVWCGDYAEKLIKDNNLYGMCYEEEDKSEPDEIRLFNKIKPRFILKDEQNYLIVNHSKKEYVKCSEINCVDKEDWRINPLPLLTAIGNGQGGGDYSGTSMDYVGSWAGDIISVEIGESELTDYTKITPDFREGENENNSEENEIKFSKKIKEWLNQDEIKKRLVMAKIR